MPWFTGPDCALPLVPLTVRLLKRLDQRAPYYEVCEHMNSKIP